MIFGQTYLQVIIKIAQFSYLLTPRWHSAETLQVVSVMLVIQKFLGGATVKKNVGKTSGEAAEVVYQWYFVC